MAASQRFIADVNDSDNDDELDFERQAGQKKLDAQFKLNNAHRKKPRRQPNLRVTFAEEDAEEFVNIPSPKDAVFVNEQGEEDDLDTFRPTLEGKHEAVELKDFKMRPESLLRVPSYAVLPGELNREPSKLACLKTPLTHIASAITPLSFALNAFVGFSGIKLEELSAEKFNELGKGTQALCWLSGLSSEVINYVSNLQNIPDAFECVSHLKESFGKHPGRNMLILVLASGASVSAAAIGASAMAFAGTVPAILNMTASGFLFWVTRFYGLVNLSKRFNKYREQGTYEDLLNRLSKDDTFLQELSQHYSDEINDFITKYQHDGKRVDAEIVYDLLQTQLKLMREHPELELQKKSPCETLLEVLNWSLASLAAISVVPTFAQKFLSGMAKAEEFFAEKITGSGSYVIEHGNIYVKQIAGTIFGIATPLAYLNACSQLKDTLCDSWEALFDASTSCWRKAVAPFIFLANALAGMSGYNLTKGVIQDPKYVFKDITPPDSAYDLTNRYIALVATASVNGKFVAGKLLPAPKPEAKADNANGNTTDILKRLTKDAIKFMKKNDFSEDAIAELDKAKARADSAKADYDSVDDDGFVLVGDSDNPVASLKAPLLIEDDYTNDSPKAAADSAELSPTTLGLALKEMNEQHSKKYGWFDNVNKKMAEQHRKNVRSDRGWR